MNNEIPTELIAPIVNPATFTDQNNPDEIFASRGGNPCQEPFSRQTTDDHISR